MAILLPSQNNTVLKREYRVYFECSEPYSKLSTLIMSNGELEIKKCNIGTILTGTKESVSDEVNKHNKEYHVS